MIRENIKKLIGRKVSSIKEKFGSRLYVDFDSEKIVDINHSDIQNTFGIRIVSYGASWRIISRGEFICGCNDDHDVVEKSISQLTIGKVIDVESENPFDLCIKLEGDITIEFLCISKIETVLFIDVPVSGKTYELDHMAWYRDKTRELGKENEEIDTFIESYKDQTIQRWNTSIPVQEENFLCDCCFFFRGIDGYFRDIEFGICSNPDSKYDGNLMKASTGCSQAKGLRDLC